jgi:hypothetical protein
MCTVSILLVIIWSLNVEVQLFSDDLLIDL